MKKLLGIALLSLCLLTGCGQSGGEYLGKWVHTKSEKRTMEIVRNGDNFLIRSTEPSFTGKIQTTNHPAIMKDGLLQTSTAFGAVSFAVDKSTGHLTAGNAEYVKQD